MTEQNPAPPTFAEALAAAKATLDRAMGCDPAQATAFNGVADSYLAVAELIHRRERGM